MIKTCVFSDSHGCAQHMITAVERENPSLCFFLGDGERDFRELQERFPLLSFYAVRGNCDLRPTLSKALVCTVGGVGILVTHGHLYQVKYEPAYESLIAAAQEAGAGLVLFGHTHHPTLERHAGITLLNPGSIGRTAYPAYAVLSLEDGRFSAELKAL